MGGLVPYGMPKHGSLFITNNFKVPESQSPNPKKALVIYLNRMNDSLTQTPVLKILVDELKTYIQENVYKI